jgi:hypothetical protein
MCTEIEAEYREEIDNENRDIYHSPQKETLGKGAYENSHFEAALSD